VEKSTLLLLILLLGISTYIWSSRTAKSVALTAGNKLHSLPGFHGYYASIWCILPGVLTILLWSSLEGSIITSSVLKSMPPEMTSNGPEQLSLVVNDIRNVVAGSHIADISPEVAHAAEKFKSLSQLSNTLLTLISLSLCGLGIFFARSKIAPEFQARNRVERFLTSALIGCALIAILTTLGIVLSVLLESIRF